MSDLAKKVADRFRSEAVLNQAFDEDEQRAAHSALAAFIEAAQASRDDVECAILGGNTPRQSYLGSLCYCKQCKSALAYDAALRALADAMEVK